MKNGKKAKAWREKVGLTVPDLEKLSGFSRESIYDFERDRRSDGKPIGEFSWHRYRLVCAAVEQQMKTGKEFEW
jgi:hypothetical protein